MFSYMGANAYDHFMAAFEKLLAEHGRGTQRRIAKSLDKSPVHINDVLKGRRRASQELQEGIAKFFGLTYEEMLTRGRRIVENRTASGGRRLPFQDELGKYAEKSHERYIAIYRKICEELDAPEMTTVIERKSRGMQGEFKSYEKGEIDDYDLFHQGKERLARILEYIIKEFGGRA